MPCTDAQRGELLLEIAQCKTMHECLANPNLAHDCSPIVGYQAANGYIPHQVPEPWNGNLRDAPLLFISSNPSISQEEQYPDINWPAANVTDFFTDRFGNLPSSPIKDGSKVLNKDGSRSDAVPFLSWIRARATELCDVPSRNVRPGVDYALTEIVHCKSKSEFGVQQALLHCARAYTERVLTCSGARILVFVGAHAATVAGMLFGLNNPPRVHGPLSICGKKRMVAFLPHSNFFGARTFARCCSSAELKSLRVFLQAP